MEIKKARLLTLNDDLFNFNSSLKEQNKILMQELESARKEIEFANNRCAIAERENHRTELEAVKQKLAAIERELWQSHLINRQQAMALHEINKGKALDSNGFEVC